MIYKGYEIDEFGKGCTVFFQGDEIYLADLDDAKAFVDINEAYNDAMNDLTFVNRSQAAFNAADNKALALVYNRHKVLNPMSVTEKERQKLRDEATALRILAIEE